MGWRVVGDETRFYVYTALIKQDIKRKNNSWRVTWPQSGPIWMPGFWTVFQWKLAFCPEKIIIGTVFVKTTGIELALFSKWRNKAVIKACLKKFWISSKGLDFSSKTWKVSKIFRLLRAGKYGRWTWDRPESFL